jgi:hypothetical protein
MATPVNRFENLIVLLGPFARQRTGAAAQPVAPLPWTSGGGSNSTHYDLDFLAVCEAEVGVNLDRFAVHPTTRGSRHIDPLHRWGV